MNELELICEVKEVKAKKQGLDIEFRIVLVTDDMSALSLGMLKADTLIKARIEEVSE